MSLHEVGAGSDSDRMTATAGADTPSAADRLSPSAAEAFASDVRKLAEQVDVARLIGEAAPDDLQRRADEIYKGDRAQDINENRCPICGGLNPGDVTHTRCI